MPNNVYVSPETAITFKASGGSAVLTMTSLANGAGRVSAQIDRGAGAHAAKYLVEVQTKSGTAMTVGGTLQVYLAMAQADATQPDGAVGQVDAALTSIEQRRNLLLACIAEAPVTTSGAQLKASGEVVVSARYVSVVPVNELGAALSATASDHIITLTPIPDQIQ